MRKWNLLLAGVAILLLFIVVAQPRLSRAAPNSTLVTATPITDSEKTEFEKALQSAASSNQKAIPAFLLYKVSVDHVQVSPDDLSALVWMVLIDPQNNQPLATEPGLAIARRADPQASWQITLPTSKDWNTQVAGLPDSLLSKESKTLLLPSQQNAKLATTDQVFTGYLLPWEGGKRVWLTGSVAHFTTYNSCSWLTVNGDYHSTCRYAFDFSDGTNFKVLAARGGSVVGARWTCTNDDHNCLNYLALEDRSTNPVTTALYLHLAQNSIPNALRVNGTYVNQGDFLALADNTGLSTGSHLHFMVVGNRWLASGYGGQFWWGDSVDISFSEVDINGGRPRLCSEAYYTPQYGSQCHPKNTSAGEWFDNWFISGNRGPTPPTALLTAPAAYTEVTSSMLNVSGSASDNAGISRIKVIANFDNTWQEIGPEITSNPFSTNLDLCASGLPNGPVSLALWAWDNEGSRSPLPQDPRPIMKNTVCPPPAPKCAPNANQVALYSQTDYQGSCQLFEVGKYGNTQLGALGNDQAFSIQVGANVMALLYQDLYENGVMKGRSEAFLSNDPGLADNRIGAQKTSSLEVKARAKPTAPILRPVMNRIDASSNPIALTSNDSIELVWKSDYNTFPADEGGTEYRATLTYPNGNQRFSPWQTANSWSIGSLPADDHGYTWTVTARNLAGETTAVPQTLRVTAATPLGGTPRGMPYADNFENGTNGWTGSGLWHQAKPPAGTASNGNTSLAWGFTNGVDYADGFVAGGDLTSPPLTIPSGGAFFKFRYYSATEDSGPYWDQRHVQISADGGEFQDVLQLTDDPIGEWQYSPAISLSAYAGKTVRVRFFFHIVDKYANASAGWWIDDFTLLASGGDAACTETVTNDTPNTASWMGLNLSVSGTICPAGDVDYYRFDANAGTTLSVDVVAKAEGSALDPYLYLIDGDGKSILAENDDIQYGVVQDSHIAYTIQRSGSYYLKVKAYNHPGVGGTNYSYRLVLNGDGQLPVVNFTYPYNGWISSTPFDLMANAADDQGMARVDFYWHSPDWRNGTWDLIGSDTTIADGWEVRFDPSGRTIPGSALVARAYDLSGQVSAAVLWNLQIDATPPVSALQGLPATTSTTVISLKWTGSDSGTGLNQFELQSSDNGGAWTAVGSFPPSQTSAFFTGVGGHTYGFRVRGVDNAGNTGTYPAAAQATTTIAATCTADAFDATQPGDNTSSSAVQLPLKIAQEHNFCPAMDQDWTRFTAQAGVAYQVKVNSLAGGAAAIVSVTDPGGSKVLVQGRAAGFGQPTVVKFVAPLDGEYKIQVQTLDARLWGTDARYAISVMAAKWFYMPAMYKKP